jgi:hypothetical protein
MIRPSSWKFAPPEIRTFSHGGRGCLCGGSAGVFDKMLKGAAIFQSDRQQLISFYASASLETIRAPRRRQRFRSGDLFELNHI